VSPWTDLFLGIIAVATALMALLQLGAVVAAARLVGRVNQLTNQVEQDIKPIVGRLTTITEEASRAATIVAAQVERIDSLLTDVATRVEDTVTTVQQVVIAPAREGMALLSAIRAVLGTLRLVKTRPTRLDEEEALFIG
jgi:hypothetical protein